jgi:hypothetical protein
MTLDTLMHNGDMKYFKWETILLESMMGSDM